MTTKDVFEKNQILTVAKAKQLKGKKIAITHPVYKANKTSLDIFIVGDITTSWDYAAKTPYPNALDKSPTYYNLQQYWESYMTDEQIDEQKTQLMLLSEKGEPMAVAHTKYYNFYSEPTFTKSDADREVYYIEL